MFINTALITLILQADIYGFMPAIFISNIIPPVKYIQQGNDSQLATDFDSEWYVNIGSKIATTWIINIFSPHLIELLLLPLMKCLRERNAKNAII